MGDGLQLDQRDLTRAYNQAIGALISEVGYACQPQMRRVIEACDELVRVASIAQSYRMIHQLEEQVARHREHIEMLEERPGGG